MTAVPGMGRLMNLRRSAAPSAPNVPPTPEQVEDVIRDMDPYGEVFPRKIKRIDRIVRY